MLMWSYDCPLAENDHFDVLVWRKGQQHTGVTWTKDYEHTLDHKVYEAGGYYWSVAVVRGQGGVVESWVTDEALHRYFEWN